MLLRFFSNESRTMSVLFASILIPAVAAVGLTIDYARALRTKTHLQAVVDASAAAGARLPATANSNRTEAATKVFLLTPELADAY